MSFSFSSLTSQNLSYRLKFPQNFAPDSRALFTNLACLFSSDPSKDPVSDPDSMLRVPCVYSLATLALFPKKTQLKINTEYFFYIYGFKYPPYKIIANPVAGSTESFLSTEKPHIQEQLEFEKRIHKTSGEFTLVSLLNDTLTHRSSSATWDSSLTPSPLKALQLSAKSSFRGLPSDYSLGFGSTSGVFRDSLLQVVLPHEFFDDFVFDKREYKYFERVYPANRPGHPVSQNCAFFFDNGQVSQRASLQCRFDLASRSYLIFGFNDASLSGLNQRDFLTTSLNSSFHDFLNSGRSNVWDI